MARRCFVTESGLLTILCYNRYLWFRQKLPQQPNHLIDAPCLFRLEQQPQSISGFLLLDRDAIGIDLYKILVAAHLIHKGFNTSSA